MRKKIKIILFLITFLFLTCKINAASYHFYIQFTDKNNSPFSLSNPSEYLSERALERRTFFNIPVDSTDLPVNPQYINQLQNLGFRVHATTKWLNGVTVLLNDSLHINAAQGLSFVKSIQFTGYNFNNIGASLPKKAPVANYNYGEAFQQINQLNGQVLHQMGYSGEGIYIAVIDAGFKAVNTNPGFQKMRSEGRLIGTKDFVNPQSNIFTEHSHGAFVLSTMASEIEGKHVGTAPKASYLLLRTEADNGEYLYEPDLWISAAEYADSLGVDVMTTSLGYTTFDDPAMNYTYSDLDGKTARASIAANMAFNKGIIVVNSAGNEGNKVWKYISVPADAEGVLTVGSVNINGDRSYFSSFGPTADGRIKPELCANGSTPRMLHADGSVFYGSGTSFSAPIMAGLAACYLQAAKALQPSLSLNEIRNNIYKSANLYGNPNNAIGYGIPNFQKAYGNLLPSSLQKISPTDSQHKSIFKIYISENQENITIELSENNHKSAGYFTLYSITGQLVSKQPYAESILRINSGKLKTGFYFIKLESTP